MSFTSFKAFKYFENFIIIQLRSFFSPFLSAVSDSHDAPPPTAHQLLIQLRIGFEYVALAIYILCFDYNDPRRCMIHAYDKWFALFMFLMLEFVERDKRGDLKHITAFHAAIYSARAILYRSLIRLFTVNSTKLITNSSLRIFSLSTDEDNNQLLCHAGWIISCFCRDRIFSIIRIYARNVSRIKGVIQQFITAGGVGGWRARWMRSEIAMKNK